MFLQQVAQSGRYSYHFNKNIFLRISTLPLSLAKKVVLSELYLNFSTTRNQLINSMILNTLMNKKQGLLLFSGPTGSGKEYINVSNGLIHANKALNLNVISIEDPVEMQIPGIVQINVNDKAGINYVNSFKAILRCDPDVILIGGNQEIKMLPSGCYTG